MITIYKFPLNIGSTCISMPDGAKLLDVQVQHNEPWVWALVDTSNYYHDITIDIYGTGHEMPENPGKYIGTIQLAGGNFVGHVFDTSRGPV